MREEELIAALCARVPHQGTPWGPGDDGALLEPTSGTGRRVLTTDAYVEGVHFLREHPPSWLAEKLLAANLADVAAMGAVPEAYTLTACLPRDVPSRWWEAFCDGLGVASRRAGVDVAGGDTTGSPSGVLLSVTAWGALEGPESLVRTGGCPGDLLMVLGTPGLSRAGWERWAKTPRTGWGAEPPPDPDPALLAHLRPRPDWSAGPWALAQGARAGMDLSDGLARDGARLARASGVDLVLDVALLPPLPPGIELDDAGRLAGGEEHELMVLIPPRAEERFTARGFVGLGYAEATTGSPELRVVSRGSPVDLEPRPYEHFPGTVK